MASPLSIQSGPTRLEFFPDTPARQQVFANVSGGSPGTVEFQIVDALISPTGGFLDADFGTTPNTLDGFIEIEPSSTRYEPTDERQRFEAMITVDLTRIDRPRYGSLLVRLVPDPIPGGEVDVQVTGAIALQVLAAPSAEALTGLSASEPALSLESLSASSLSPWTMIDRAFPDIPRVINHGPVVAIASGRNTGDFILDQRVTYEFYRVSPFTAIAGGEAGPPVYRAENVPRFLLAGQDFTDRLISLIRVEGAPTVDSLPFIGFVRLRATATGNIAGLEASPASKTITFLVFPWKELLFVFLVWLFQREWRHRRGRRQDLTPEGMLEPSRRARIREGVRRAINRRRSSAGGTLVDTTPLDQHNPPSDGTDEGRAS